MGRSRSHPNSLKNLQKGTPFEKGNQLGCKAKGIKKKTVRLSDIMDKEIFRETLDEHGKIVENAPIASLINKIKNESMLDIDTAKFFLKLLIDYDKANKPQTNININTNQDKLTREQRLAMGLTVEGDE